MRRPGEFALGVAARVAAVARGSAAVAAPPAGRWVGSWASAQQAPAPGAGPTVGDLASGDLAPGDLDNATLREVVHLSVGGAQVRVRVSNAFGDAPLVFAGVHLARAVAPGSAAVEAGSDRAVTFDGRAQVTVPAGADYWSDPVALAAPDGADLAVSLHFIQGPHAQTGHSASRATSFLAPGDLAAAPDLPGARRIAHWFAVSGVDVEGSARGAVVALGDSITDGHASTLDGNDRWPDDLARRLHAAGRAVGVLNVGIGGNHILTDGLGPNAVSRFDRDVLAQSGARAVILLEGINDLGMLSRDAPDAPHGVHVALLARLYAADAQMIARAREHGLKVIGATLGPYLGSDYYRPAAANEADRQALNAWIRAPGRFDAVIDFDSAVRDPARPDRMRAAYDSGDHLHPSPAGYRAMAAAIPLDLLAR